MMIMFLKSSISSITAKDMIFHYMYLQDNKIYIKDLTL